MFMLYLFIFVLMMIECCIIIWWCTRMKGPPRTVTAWASSIIFIAIVWVTPLSQIKLYWKLAGRSPSDDLLLGFVVVGETLFALAAILFVASKGEKAKRGQTTDQTDDGSA